MLEGWQKDRLRSNRVELVNDMVADDLLNNLYSLKIITKRQLLDIPFRRNPLQQNENILNLLETRPPGDYFRFCDALRETNQGELVDRYLADDEEEDDTRTSASTRLNTPMSPMKGTTAGHTPLPGTSGLPVPDVSNSPTVPRSETTQPGSSIKVEPSGTLRISTGDFCSTPFECDAVHDVCVTSSTQEFYNQTKTMAFPMNKAKRGKAVIFNISSIFGRKPRKGTDVDREKLHDLFIDLNFDVLVYNDADGLTAEGLINKFRAFSAMFTDEDQCAVACFLSHGGEGSLYGTDGQEVDTEFLLDMLDNRQCPAMRGKPKLVFIQACRGKKADTGVLYESDAIIEGPQIRRHPIREDYLVAYPTQPGYMSWRNTKKGSFFIGALVQIFMQYAAKEDICTLLHMVNKVVSRTVANIEGIEHVEMSMFESSLSTHPKFYFYPGIVEETPQA